MISLSPNETAEAIRKGAKGTRQGFGHNNYRLNNHTHLCALGALMNGIKIDSEMDFGLAFTLPNACPVCPKVWPALSMLVHLNDEHFWTREKIADWIESSGIV